MRCCIAKIFFVCFYMGPTHTLFLEQRSKGTIPNFIKVCKGLRDSIKIMYVSPSSFTLQNDTELNFIEVQQSSFQSINIFLMYKWIHVTIPYNEDWATHSIDNNNHSNNLTKSDWLSLVQHVFRTFMSLPSNILPLHHSRKPCNATNCFDFSLKSWNVTHLQKLQSTVF